MKHKTHWKWLAGLALTLALAACGGGGGGGSSTSGGTSTLASGTVTAIHSVEVNGVTYSCDGATVISDDNTIDQGSGDRCVAAAAQGLLKPGMVVTVTGTSDGTQGTATQVRFGNNLEGLVTAVSTANASLTVLGQTVLVDDATIFEVSGHSKTTGPGALSFLTAGVTVVEVSGFPTGNGTILATFVQDKPGISSGGEFEIKGVVSVSGGTATINGLIIAAGSFTTPALADGACFELKGNFNAASNTLTLTRAPHVEDDCNGFSSGSSAQAEVEGIVNNLQTTATGLSFNVGAQLVSTTSATVFRGGTADDLTDGTKVEAEGPITNGVLLARKVSFKPGVRIQAAADGKGDDATNSVVVLGITVKKTANTELKDLTKMSDIQTGQRLRIRGFKTGPNSVTASRIERRDGDNGATEIRGPLDANPTSPTFSILGVVVTTSAGTEFEETSSADFFNNAKQGTVVKAKGSETDGNGVNASEVELED